MLLSVFSVTASLNNKMFSASIFYALPSREIINHSLIYHTEFLGIFTCFLEYVVLQNAHLFAKNVFKYTSCRKKDYVL